LNNTDQIWRQIILPVESTIGQVIENLNKHSAKIVLITNEFRFFEGTVTDGDIRRGLISGLDLDSPIKSIIARNALAVPSDISLNKVKQLMIENKIYQIPILDDQRHIVGLHLWDKIDVPNSKTNLVVIMAGGIGSRLRPHTEKCPKPMLLVHGKPILEHIINRIKLEGFNNFVIAIHYLGEVIEKYFENGEKFGVSIKYLREDSPRGTAGALKLINPLPDNPFLVTNGDVITDIQYSDILSFHLKNSAAATMAVRVHEIQHLYGVVKTDGIDIVEFEEKPVIRSNINAGVYVLDPIALNGLPDSKYCDMPVLFDRIRKNSNRTIVYPLHEN